MKRPIPFGKYYLLDRINVGGMAEVFKAKAFGVEGFERLVAVKRILPNIAEDKEFITMFIDEAKIAVQLQHANIAQIFDLGKVEDSYFIALEHVHGKDLRALFDRCRKVAENMPIAQSAFCVMKICEGLDYAHNKKDAAGRELQLVHRDVSPQNILVSYEGEVKLIDFGIAKAAGKHSKTDAGILKGKFGYMSPEQVRGLPLDRRSDVFSVGIILYELLTGERLFLGESDFSTLEKVRNVEILPPSTYNRQIPDELERIVLRTLAKDVDERYQHAIELHDDLQAFLYAAGLFYSRKDLAAWMKKTFAQEIDKETRKLEEYQKLIPPEPRSSRPTPLPERVPERAERPAGRREAPRDSKGPPPLPNSVVMKASHLKPPGKARTERPRLEEVTPVVNARDLEASEVIEPASDPRLNLDVRSSKGPPRPAPGTPARRTGARPSSRGDVNGVEPETPAMRPGTLFPTAAPSAPTHLDDWDDDEGETAIYDKDEPPPPAAPEPAAARATKNGPAAAAAPPAVVVNFEPTPVPQPPREPPLTLTPTPGPIDFAPVGVPNLPTIADHDEAANRRTMLISVSMAVLVLAAVGAAALLYFSRSGSISIDTSPRDVQIAVNSRVVDTRGPTPVTITNLAPGTHRVAITRDGYLPYSATVRVNAGKEPTPLKVTLEPIAATGFTLTSSPPGGKVTLDGVDHTQPAPLRISGLTPGPHVLRVVLGDDYYPWQKTVEIERGRLTDVVVKLRPKKVMATITSNAPGAVAILEGKAGPKRLGLTPYSGFLTPGADEELTLVIDAKGFRSYRERLEVDGHTTVSVNANLQSEADGPPPAPAGTGAVSPPPAPTPPAPTPTPTPPAPPVAPPPAPKVTPPPPAAKAPKVKPERPKKVARAKEPKAPAAPPDPPVPKATPPKPAVVAGSGFLGVNSRPAAKIVIDGKDTGLFTPQAAIKLSAGVHRVTLINEEQSITRNFRVTIAPDETTKLKAVPLK